MSLVTDLFNLDLSDSTEKIIAEYIWIGGSGMDLRSKRRTIPGPVSDPHKLPKWNYDGSSTGQPPGEDSEVILHPQAIFKDPFRGANNILVMCDAYTPAGEPISTNKRYNAAKIFSHPDVVVEEPWYGIEQEYTLLQKEVKWPIGWPVGGYAGPQGPYYCGGGADKAFGRGIVDAHYKAYLCAGISLSGIIGEVMSGQGDWNGTGAHTNYSSKSMRNNGVYDIMKKANVEPRPPKRLSSRTFLVSKRLRSDDSDWIEESVVKQRTKLFEINGSIRGFGGRFKGLFIMDSGSHANCVSQSLVSRLRLPVEDIDTPYYSQWLNQESRIPVTKRCLVKFSIGNKYEDKIWCDVVPMDVCDVLLGRPWQWDRNVVYRGRDNVYKLKVRGRPVKLFPIRG